MPCSLFVAAPSPRQRKNGERESLSPFFLHRGEGAATCRLMPLGQLASTLLFGLPVEIYMYTAFLINIVGKPTQRDFIAIWAI